jgi:hypothetical protein
MLFSGGPNTRPLFTCTTSLKSDQSENTSAISKRTTRQNVINLKIFRNNPLIDPELLSALTIWIEDVPQITINIFIALCREDAISYYQIIKAGVIIFGGLIRVLMGFLRFG